MKTIKFLTIVLAVFTLTSCHKAITFNAEVKQIASKKELKESDLSRFLAHYAMEKENFSKNIIGHTKMPLTRGDSKGSLCTLINNSMITYAQQQFPEVAVAVVNIGGIRKEIEAGDITMGDVFEVMPFDNTIVVLTLKGEEILNLCKIVASNPASAAIGGVKIKSKTPKASNTYINGKPIDLEKDYLVVTSDYLASGNDKLSPLANYSEIVYTGKLMRDAIIDEIKINLPKPIFN